MAFLVQLTDDAAHDLEELCECIDQHDEPGGLGARADRKDCTRRYGMSLTRVTVRPTMPTAMSHSCL